MEKLEELYELYCRRDVLLMRKQELIDSVMTPEVRQAIADIEAEFALKTAVVDEDISRVENEVKEFALSEMSTLKGSHLQAVYAKGRVTWDTKTLDGLAIAMPEICVARKTGAPSVSIRKIG